MTKPVIKIDHVYKTYQNDDVPITVLSNICFSIHQGEFVAIMGPSGSGKSTLMHILGALDIPTKGTYCLNGQDMANHADRELAGIRNKSIGYVFQSFNLLPRTSLLDNVMLPMEYAGMPESVQRKRAIRYLSQVGLGDRLHYPPNKLSGGQQQRAAIARALAMNPSIILADEPTGNIASAQAKEVMKLFQTANRQYGHTIIMITHEQQIAAYAKRVITLVDGKITSDTARRVKKAITI
jgi:putative ABC transport system ATP-binding protein